MLLLSVDIADCKAALFSFPRNMTDVPADSITRYPDLAVHPDGEWPVVQRLPVRIVARRGGEPEPVSRLRRDRHGVPAAVRLRAWLARTDLRDPADVGRQRRRRHRGQPEGLRRPRREPARWRRVARYSRASVRRRLLQLAAAAIPGELPEGLPVPRSRGHAGLCPLTPPGLRLPTRASAAVRAHIHPQAARPIGTIAARSAGCSMRLRRTCS